VRGFCGDVAFLTTVFFFEDTTFFSLFLSFFFDGEGAIFVVI